MGSVCTWPVLRTAPALRARGSAAMFLIAGVLPMASMTPHAKAQPANDSCANATVVTAATPVTGTALGATPDGQSTCNFENTPDVYHRFTATRAGVHVFSLCTGTTWDTVLSLHAGCPATAAITNQIACDDEGCRPANSPLLGFPSKLSWYLQAGQSVIVRISGYDMNAGFGAYRLAVTEPQVRLGACCALGSCTIVDQSSCVAIFGTYRGDQSACTLPAQTPTTYAGPTTPVNIPDDNATGVSSSIVVPDTFAVAGVRVSVNISHTYLGDLTIRLRKGTTAITLMDRVGNGPLFAPGNLGGTYVFDDQAQNSPWAAALGLADDQTLPAGSYLASDATSNIVSMARGFSGVSSLGTWSLEVIDNAAPDTGVLATWSLTLDRAGPNACDTLGACCTGSGGLTCSFTTSTACATLGGSFKGANSVCSNGTNNPIACCRANFDQQGGVQVADIFAYLSAFFAGSPSAEFDGVQGIGVGDIFAFLSLWFAGCP